MLWIYGFIGLLYGIVALVAAWPFLPLVQSFTNISNSVMNDALNSTYVIDTPLVPIMRLWPVWAILLIGICVILIFVLTARRSG